MNIQPDKCLRELNSFAFSVRAARFCAPADSDSLLEALAARHAGEPLLLLGGGSNVVLVRDWPGLVLKPDLRGIELLGEEAGRVLIRVAAGEDWPSLVEHALAQGWYGLENLSLIPGSAGAAPIQNIGAYGVELSEHLVAVEAVELASGNLVRLSCNECEFGYRDSLFKRAGRDQYIITAIELELSRQPRLRTGYGEIQSELQAMGVEEATPLDVSRAVIAIRRRKLPDPLELPNAGSFFKNPEIDASSHDALKQQYPELVSHRIAADCYKVAAGWMIDQCGWKGRRRGDAGVHSAQALVLVNYGQACGTDILDLAADIQADVKARYGLQLEIEPRIY